MNFKTFFSIVAISMFGTLVYAEDNKNPLNLTEEQVQAIQKVGQKHMELSQAIVNSETLTQEEKQAQLSELHEIVKEEAAAVLTPEQKEKLDTLERRR